MKRPVKILLIALAGLIYGAGLYVTLLVLRAVVDEADVFAWYAFVAACLLLLLPGLVGALVVYRNALRARDDRFTALAWASTSALLAAIIPLLFFLTVVMPVLPYELRYEITIILSIAGSILAPGTALRIRRRVRPRDRQTQ